MDRTVETSCLSFFTSNHSQHAKQWLRKGSQMTLVCFACFVEIIENKNEPSIRKTKALQELLTLLSNTDIHKILACSESVLFHLVNCLWELTDTADQDTTQNITAVEMVYQLCSSIKLGTLLDKVMEHISQELLTTENNKKVFPYLNLLGKLLQKIEGLTKRFVRQVNVVEYLVKSTSFPDGEIRSALFFILAVLYRDCYSEIPASMTEIVLRECSEVLTTATSKELQINSIALLQSITVPGHTSTCSPIITANIERIKTGLKKAFLARNDLVQSLAVSCLNNLVLFDERIISSDLISFLFEVFKTKSEPLLAQGFQSLTHLVENHEFYAKGHALYGFESVVSALIKPAENRNTKLVKQGFGVFIKFLGNCPTELSLISGASILGKCLDTLASGLSSLDDGVALQACRCFSLFLEKRHHTCPIPYAKLLVLIESLMERLCKICQGTGHWGRTENKDLKASMLSAILEVIKRSLHLALSGRNEPPSLESLLVAQGNSTRDELEQFTNELLQLCDQICIPNVIGRLQSFYGSAVPEIFFEILNKLLFMCPDATKMSRKFASSSFIRICLDIKAECVGKVNTKSLQETVNKFLDCMCRHLFPGHMEEELRHLAPSLKKVNGRAPELIQVLKQNHSGDDGLRTTQECILVLFYTAYQHGDKLVNSSQLIHALSTLLVLNPSCYQHSVIISKCLTYLYITEAPYVASKMENTTALLSNAEHILANEISKYENKVDMVYFHDFALVEWTIKMKELSLGVRKEILEMWFSYDSETNDKERWKSLLTNYPDFLLIFAGILRSSEHQVQYAILNILQNVLPAVDTKSPTTRESLKDLKNSFQQIFLDQAIEPVADENLASVLKLLCLLVTSSPHTPLDDDVIKLVYHTVNLLLRSRDSFDLATECLNFLNACIIQDRKMGCDQVANLLVKHQDYNKFLETILASFQEATFPKSSLKVLTILSTVLTSIANLLNSQKVFGIYSENSIEIKVEFTLSFLCHSSPMLQFSGNIFWASVIESENSSTNILLKTRSQVALLSKTHRKVILVRLQNSLLHNNPIVQLSALRCLKALLYFDNDPTYLLQNPWNKAILRELKDCCSSPENLALCLNVHSLFFRHNRKNGLAVDFSVTELLQYALQKFTDYEVNAQVNRQYLLLSACIEFFCEVMESSPDALSSIAISSLRLHVEHLIETFHEESHSIGCTGFMYVNNMLIHEEFIQEKGNDSLKILNDFLEVLK